MTKKLFTVIAIVATVGALVATAAALAGTAATGSSATLTFAYPGGATAVTTATVDESGRGTTVLTLDSSTRFTACPLLSSLTVTKVDDDGVLLAWSPSSARSEYREFQSMRGGLLISGPIAPCPKVMSLLITMSYMRA